MVAPRIRDASAAGRNEPLNYLDQFGYRFVNIATNRAVQADETNNLSEYLFAIHRNCHALHLMGTGTDLAGKADPKSLAGVAYPPGQSGPTRA